MWRSALGIVTGMWLIASAGIWQQRPETAFIAVVAGFTAVVLAAGTVLFPRACGMALAITGGLLALSNFMFRNQMPVVANHTVIAFVFLATGLPLRRTVFVASTGSPEAHTRFDPEPGTGVSPPPNRPALGG